MNYLLLPFNNKHSYWFFVFVWMIRALTFFSPATETGISLRLPRYPKIGVSSRIKNIKNKKMNYG